MYIDFEGSSKIFNKNVNFNKNSSTRFIQKINFVQIGLGQYYSIFTKDNYRD